MTSFSSTGTGTNASIRPQKRKCSSYRIMSCCGTQRLNFEDFHIAKHQEPLWPVQQQGQLVGYRPSMGKKSAGTSRFKFKIVIVFS